MIKITKDQIASAKQKIPCADLVNKSYDTDFLGKPRGLFFLLSTPRSGSTLVCDLLNKCGFCLAHEYFQPYEYLPILASRWDCLECGRLDEKKYVNQLVRFRTLNSGWLGINLHGHHLPVFSRFVKYFPGSEKVVIRIRRRDVVAQAVSYEIAHQTGRWSSEFGAAVEPVYSFHAIKEKVNIINTQNLLTDAFLSARSENAVEIYYEDFIEDPLSILSSVLPDAYHQKLTVDTGLKKQSSIINKEWAERFSRELFDTYSLRGAWKKKVLGLFKNRL